MRNVIFLMLFLTGHFCFGQQRQISFHLNSGLFSYGGSSASETSFINISDVSNISSYTNNPYGKNSSFSYGLGVQLQQLTRKNFIYGLQLSYESLSSKLTIDNAYGEITWSVEDGQTILTTDFINLFPSIGQRVNLFKKVDTDFLLGFDLGIGISSKEHYNLTTSQGDQISGTNEKEEPPIDFRPRLDVVNYYKNFGLSIGYSYGLTNYQSDLIGADKEVYARYLRFGICYRL
jgi:hypothetical protein